MKQDDTTDVDMDMLELEVMETIMAVLMVMETDMDRIHTMDKHIF